MCCEYTTFRYTQCWQLPKMPAHLDSSELPPFKPKKNVVHCSNNNQMSALRWAFNSCIPQMSRLSYAALSGESNASARVNTTPAMQWNYSLFHLAHHYETGHPGKFSVTDEDDTVSIFLEISSLRACPEGVSGVLPRSEFVDPQDMTPLGDLPVFFVRYLYEEKGGKDSEGCWEPSAEAFNFLTNHGTENIPMMNITAASIDEISFAHRELQRGQSLLGKAFTRGKINESVLFPRPVKAKSAEKAPYICASCDAIISARPAPSCSRCKTTYYCNRECQTSHWKYHKKVCCKKVSRDSGQRKSFFFDVKPLDDSRFSFNHKSGIQRVAGMSKEQRSEMKRKGQKVSKAPTGKNIHGDKEFIVKLQPPAAGCGDGLPPGNWMCYDGPTRSFQLYVPAGTAELPEVYSLLQREGVKTSNPMFGNHGYKGYFYAKWEGGSIRVFYDRLASPQVW